MEALNTEDFIKIIELMLERLEGLTDEHYIDGEYEIDHWRSDELLQVIDSMRKLLKKEMEKK